MEKIKLTRENCGEQLMKYQLAMIDKTLMDVVDDDRWRFNFTLTAVQQDEFRNYAIPAIRKLYKCNRLVSISIFEDFLKQFKLRTKN